MTLGTKYINIEPRAVVPPEIYKGDGRTSGAGSQHLHPHQHHQADRYSSKPLITTSSPINLKMQFPTLKFTVLAILGSATSVSAICPGFNYGVGHVRNLGNGVSRCESEHLSLPVFLRPPTLQVLEHLALVPEHSALVPQINHNRTNQSRNYKGTCTIPTAGSSMALPPPRTSVMMACSRAALRRSPSLGTEAALTA